MWDRDFLDKWDMGRRIEARLFCFGSGDSDEPSGGGSARNENNDRDPAQRVASVVGMNPTLVEMAQSATPAQRAANAAENDRIFNDFIANDIMNQRMDAATSPRVQVFEMDDAAGDYMLNPSLSRRRPADISVASTNLPPAIINDFGVAFDTTTGDLISRPQPAAELFRAQESQRAMGLDQRQAGYDAYQAMLGNAVADAQGNIDSATGLLGAPTRFMNQMFIDGMNTRIGDRNSDAYQSYLNDARLFEPVYSQRGRLTGYRDQFGRLTGTDPISAAAAMGEDDERMVEPEVNPMTDKPRCPDGYVFDEDLQACRLDTSTSVDQAAPPDGEIFFRRTSLDDAPANLPSGFDFDAANTRFVQSYGSRPDFYRSPMSLTGFTRL